MMIRPLLPVSLPAPLLALVLALSLWAPRAPAQPAAAATPAPLAAAPVAAVPAEADLRHAFQAFFPLYEMARLRYTAIEDKANPRRHDVNTLTHVRALLDDTARTVTAPNNDTLYSSARLDLRLGPVRLTLPAMPGRYRSVQLMNFHTDNLAILGSRPDEQGPLEVLVIGPGQSVPAAEAARATHRVQADTFDLWLLVRTLVDGPADLPVVAALQDQMRLLAPRPAADYPAQRRAPPREATPEAFVAVVNEFLERNPPTGGMAALARAAQPLGLGPGALPWERLDEPVRAAWAQAWPAALASLRNPALMVGRRVQGWDYPPAAVGRIGDGSEQVPLRATVALRGIGALDGREALYLATSTDAAGQPLDGRQAYRVRLPAGGLATGAFWSLSMYEVMPDGRAFFVGNPLRRFSIGSRTPGLQPAADGTLALRLQHAAPAEGPANWLPAPAGPFRLMLRAYLPAPALVAGEAPLPVVERLAAP